MLWKHIKAYSFRLYIISQQTPTETSKSPDEFSLQRKVWARSSVRLERRTLKPEDGEEIRRPRVQFPSGPPSFGFGITDCFRRSYGKFSIIGEKLAFYCFLL
jgi:hypothetical protein